MSRKPLKQDSSKTLTGRCQGTLFRASQFLSEELPIRLAHRVQELGELPDGLNEMPSIKKVRDWYSQSFEVWTILHWFCQGHWLIPGIGHNEPIETKPRLGDKRAAPAANETELARVKDSEPDYT